MKSLRDKFAMAALQGFCSMESNVDWSHEYTAAAAYQQADAMLAEREKDDIETKDQIKQMLVDAIKEEHPGINATVSLPARDLIYQLTTGKPF